MRTLSRLVVLSTLTAIVAAPTAMAANSATATISPKKGGTITVANPVSFKVKATMPDTPSNSSGSTRLLAIQAKLPVPLLFNSIPFSQCNTANFLATQSCPSSTKLGEATVLADGGPDIGEITATTVLYFGTGFNVLAKLQADKPALINEAIIGRLQSSNTTGYGLELYIPVPKIVQEPLTGLFPTVKSVDANFKPPTKSIRIPGTKGRTKLPLAGLGPCPSSRKLNFQVNALYTDATLTNITKTDSASATASCSR